MLSAHVCSCDGRQCMYHTKLGAFVSTKRVHRHSNTRHMNTPHCLQGAGQPGPTLAPALQHQM